MADCQRINYLEWRARVEQQFALMAPIHESMECHTSPSGSYILQVCEYSAGNGTWSYSRGMVLNAVTGSVIADIVRNYGIFWFTWVVRTDGEFLLCGEDYQGYNVINLTSGRNVLTFPAEGFDGCGYCWATAYPSPDGRLLAVEGCFWACPYSLTIFDFSDPFCSPLPELDRFEELDQVKGWVASGEFVFTSGESMGKNEIMWRCPDLNTGHTGGCSPI